MYTGVNALQVVVFQTNNLEQNTALPHLKCGSAAIYAFPNEKGWVYNINRVTLENQNMFHGKSDLERNIFTQFCVTTVFHSLHIHTSLTEMFFGLVCWFQKLPGFH